VLTQRQIREAPMAGNDDGVARELPKIISVDDHVVERGAGSA
jgi:hypothetical protein